jgi:hypothetical protein
VRESENTWTMKSTNNSKCYTVSRNSEICNLNEDCQLTCKRCCICIHQFECTCPDNLFNTTICKHVHFLKWWLDQDKENNINQECETPTTNDELDTTSDELDRLALLVQDKKAQSGTKALRACLYGDKLTG